MSPPKIDISTSLANLTNFDPIIYTTTIGTSTNYIPTSNGSTILYSAEAQKQLTLEVVVEALRKTDEEIALLLTSPNEEERKYAELIVELRRELQGK